MISRFLPYLLAAGVAATSGCALLPRPTKDADIYDLPKIDRPKETVEGDQAITYVPLRKGLLQASLALPGDPLPEIAVGPFYFDSVPILDALREVTRQTGVSISYEGGDLDASKVTVMGASGSLAEVIEIVCRTAAAYCLYQGNDLHVSQTQTFTVYLPPMSDEVYDGLIAALKALTGHDVTVDTSLRTLSFVMSSREKPRVDAYLDHIRASRAQLIFDTYIWEVTLNDATQIGIQWNKLGIRANGRLSGALSSTATPLPDTTPMAFSTILTGNALSIDALLNFLQTQGTVKNVAQPKISMVNGSTGQFSRAGKRAYVKEVGTVALGSTGGATTTQTTVHSDVLETGLNIQITPDLVDDTIYADLILSLVDLVTIRSVKTNETEIQLPETTNRSYSSLVRIRPGDTLLVAGLNSDHTERTVGGIPTGTKLIPLPTHDDDTSDRSELVILMRPRVIEYTDGEKNALGPRLSPVMPHTPPQPLLPAPASPPAPTPKPARPRVALTE